jgi:hypothetical protein
MNGAMKDLLTTMSNSLLWEWMQSVIKATTMTPARVIKQELEICLWVQAQI